MPFFREERGARPSVINLKEGAGERAKRAVFTLRGLYKIQ